MSYVVSRQIRMWAIEKSQPFTLLTRPSPYLLCQYRLNLLKLWAKINPYFINLIRYVKLQKGHCALYYKDCYQFFLKKKNNLLMHLVRLKNFFFLFVLGLPIPLFLTLSSLASRTPSFLFSNFFPSPPPSSHHHPLLLSSLFLLIFIPLYKWASPSQLILL